MVIDVVIELNVQSRVQRIQLEQISLHDTQLCHFEVGDVWRMLR